MALTVLASAVTGFLVNAAAQRNVFRPDRTFGGALRSALGWMLARMLALLVAFAIAVFEPSGLTPWAAVGLAAELVIAWMVLTGRHGALLRPLGLFRPLPAEDSRALDEAIQRSGVKVRASGVLRVNVANALAFQLGRSVWITEKASEVLSYDEKVAIFLHELGHFDDSQNWQGPLLSACAGVLIVVIPVLFHEHPFILLAFAAAVFIGTRLLVRRRVRFEEAADAHAHEHGADKAVYARALERLYEANGVPAVMPKARLTHPHLYDRMIAAGVTPSYERPLPPKPASRLATVIVAFFCGLSFTPELVSLSSSTPRLAAFVVAETGGQSPSALWHWIDTKAKANELTDDVADLVLTLRTGLNHREARDAVRLLSLSGKCHDAKAMWAAYPRVPPRVFRASPCEGLEAEATLESALDGASDNP